MSVKAGLPPIARPDARLFVLGSLPGDASLAAPALLRSSDQPVLEAAGSSIGEDLHGLAYEERLERMARRRIGLWDVIASATRPGSLDQAIRLAEHNQIAHLLQDFPDLKAIAFNGTTASTIGRRLIGEPPSHVTLVDLPSSSAANTRPLAEKADAWARLAEFIQP